MWNISRRKNHVIYWSLNLRFPFFQTTIFFSLFIMSIFCPAKITVLTFVHRFATKFFMAKSSFGFNQNNIKNVNDLRKSMKQKQFRFTYAREWVSFCRTSHELQFRPKFSLFSYLFWKNNNKTQLYFQ